MSDLKDLELCLEKIVNWWIKEFSPPLDTEDERKYAEKALESYLHKKMRRYMDFKVFTSIDKSGQVSVNVLPMINPENNKLRRVK